MGRDVMVSDHRMTAHAIILGERDVAAVQRNDLIDKCAKIVVAAERHLDGCEKDRCGTCAAHNRNLRMLVP